MIIGTIDFCHITIPISLIYNY